MAGMGEAMQNVECRMQNGKQQRQRKHGEIPFDSAALRSGQAFAALRMTKRADGHGAAKKRSGVPWDAAPGSGC